jgi:hypothetical protein
MILQAKCDAEGVGEGQVARGEERVEGVVCFRRPLDDLLRRLKYRYA